MDMSGVTEFLSASKTLLDIFKTFRQEMPQGTKADEAQKQIAKAEEALEATKAKLAQSLGFTLCQCTFPPQIMLSKGYHETHGMELFVCPSCGKQEPSEHTIRQYDEVKADNERLDRQDSWADR